jgi:hypothetical protein
VIALLSATTALLLPCGVSRGGGGAPQSGVTVGASFPRSRKTIRRRAPSVTAFGRATCPVSLRETGEETVGYASASVRAGLTSRHGPPEQVWGKRKNIGAWLR